MLQLLTQNITAIKSKMLQFLDAKRNKLVNAKSINEKCVNLTKKRLSAIFSYLFDYTRGLIRGLNRGLSKFRRTSFKVSAPVNENSQNWNQYWLSLTRMRSLQGLHIDSPSTQCQFKAASSGAVSSEDNFGWYYKSRYNPKFRCTKDTKSTTQWWFGAHL